MIRAKKSRDSRAPHRKKKTEDKKKSEDDKGEKSVGKDEDTKQSGKGKKNNEMSRSLKPGGADEKKLVFNFVKKTLEKGPKGLKEEFNTMKRGNDFEKMKVFLDNNAKGRNRYKDVGCLDASRVKLKDYGDNDYIHANYVETPSSKKRFICAQAPLEKTCPDFWAMILQEKVENIMMLCNMTEKGAKKCHEYYPTSEDEKLTFGDYTVKCKSQKTVKFSCETSANIKETSLEVEFEGKKQKLKHYHWVDWPDRGVPPADMAVIELLGKIKSTKTPIVVHCSAGIGRTGSVVLIQYILESIAAGQEVDDCAVLLKNLRQQRNNSVQTDHQYLFVHQVMLNYFVEQNLLDSSAKPFLEKFTKQYKQLVIEK